MTDVFDFTEKYNNESSEVYIDYHSIKGTEKYYKTNKLLLKKDIPFIWTDKQQIDFDILKSK